MSLPLNPALAQGTTAIQTLPQARQWIDGVPRPTGFSPYAWNTTKRIAIEVWKCHFAGRQFRRTLNFMHPSFYQMIRTPEGLPLVSTATIRGWK